MTISRRAFIKTSALTAASVSIPASWATTAGKSKHGHVVVIGGGFSGATCAKYLRMWSDRKVKVTLIEREINYVSCPFSNLVLAGYRNISDITQSYDALQSKWGIKVIHGEVVSADSAKKTVSLKSGETINYDRLVLSPGIDFVDGKIPALAGGKNFNKIPHAYKAGVQTEILKKQLFAMKDGGVFAISIPRAPYRCPPAPYERACLVASYFKAHKPKSKILIIDANEKVQSKEKHFKAAWSELYPTMIEYLTESEVLEVDVNSKTAITDFDDIKADVLNVIPPQRAAKIVFAMNLKTINNLWAEIDWLTLESVNTPFVHVLGDAVFPASIMPKSGHMANQHGKVAAAAILNMLADKNPSEESMLVNTCYSFMDKENVVHVSSVHRYNKETNTFDPNPNHAGGLSAVRNKAEKQHAISWANNIWADSFG